MIDNLRISYDYDRDIYVTLSTDTGYDGNNLPYNLAELFARVIKDSNANEDMVIENLTEIIKDGQTKQTIYTEQNTKIIRHDSTRH